MANSNWLGGNAVYVEAPAEGLRALPTEKRTAGATRNFRATSQRERFPLLSEIAAPVIPVSALAEDTSQGLSHWVADPDTVRDYVRIDISAVDLREDESLRCAKIVAQALEVGANVDFGYSVYAGAEERRITVTLFEVTLRGAYLYFGNLRYLLRAGADVDCGRFYFRRADGTEGSYCAKRTAPAEVTRAHGLSTQLATQTHRSAYGKAQRATQVYSSAPDRRDSASV